MIDENIAELENSTAIAEPPVVEPPNNIYVAYLYGKKGKHCSRIMRTTFEDIETEEHVTQVTAYLMSEHGNEAVTIIGWSALTA